MNQTVNITIDGKTIKAPAGATVLEAALGAGIYIPNLCYHPDLSASGNCRLCIVQIHGMRGFPTACTTSVVEGMSVNTNGDELTGVRRNNLQLIIANHPLDCLSCFKNQRCELQRVAVFMGVKEGKLRSTVSPQVTDDTNPFFRLKRDYCILCGRCTRTCDEICGVNAIEMLHRGDATHVGVFGDKMLFESNCHSCGECVEHCPVGALAPHEPVVPDVETKTTCCYCATGCSIYLGVSDGKIKTVRGNREGQVNHGQLCVKGRYGISEFVQHPDRLRTPYIRDKEGLQPATWDDALSLVARKLATFSADEVAIVPSARTTNEDVYVAQKLARAVIGTNNVDNCARL
ncbi:MAG: 2Fe-2S iron-sulfur cluster-binding protein [Dehalococcoidia bacterium]|nr:2Fe-2S iron-sulfur cluster-binding protein [Dehalococcoidia bacterium]